MKKNILQRIALGICGALFSLNVHAATYTATTSGNWSDPATWGGTAPSGSLTLDNVDIPSGITVTLDMDVQFAGLLNTFNVEGKLDGNYAIWFDQGQLTGDGEIDIHKLVFSSLLSGNTFTGDLTIDVLTTDGTLLSLQGNTMVQDTLDLMAGSVILQNDADLQIEQGASIKRDAGSLSINGGEFNPAQYHVWYVGSSKTTGVEVDNSNLDRLYLSMTDNDQVITMAEDLVINGTLYLMTGRLAIGVNELTIRGDVQTTAGAFLVSNDNSDLTIVSDDFTGDLRFLAGSSLNTFKIDLDSMSSVTLSSGVDIVDELRIKDATLSLGSGLLNMRAGSTVMLEGKAKVMEDGGGFGGTAAYNVAYNTGSDTTGVEITGSGLNDVTINLENDDDWLLMNSDVNADGHFRLMNGKLSMNGNDLEINGTLGLDNGTKLIAHSSSALTLKMTTSSDDTLWFDDSGNELKDLFINLGTPGTVYLGSNLSVNDDMKLTVGNLDLGENTLTIKSPGSISQYSDENYIITSGNGMLEMNVNASDPYVTFPVGTSTSYSPAYIQQTSSGTSGNFKVRTMPGVYAEGNTGFNFATSRSAVNRTWMIESGTTVNMNLKLGWMATSEVNGFNRNQAYIAHYHNAGWEKSAGSAAVSGGMNTYELEKTGITSLSPFAVADTNTGLKVELIALQNKVHIYPNPSNRYIQLELENNTQAYSLDIVDYTGNTVMHVREEDRFRPVDISTLASGYYFIKLNMGQYEAIAGKFIKL